MQHKVFKCHVGALLSRNTCERLSVIKTGSTGEQAAKDILGGSCTPGYTRRCCCTCCGDGQKKAEEAVALKPVKLT